jgi:ABC-type amino acid transport substrate-binding protein
MTASALRRRTHALRLPPFFLALAAAAACTPVDEGGGIGRDSFEQVRARGTGAVQVLYVEAPGFAYRDADGELTGVTVELLRDFGRWVEREYDIVLTMDFIEETDWRTFYNRVRDGEGGLFGIGNVTITEPRRDELRFSPPYLHNVAVLITHESVPELSTLEELGTTFAGLRPLAFAGTLHEDRLETLRLAHMPQVPLDSADSNPEIVERVSAGPGYFAYIDAYNYWRAVAAGAALRHHPPGDEAGETFGVILPLGSDWGPIIDAYFAADGGLLDQPRYRQWLAEHLGPALADQLEAARASGREPATSPE